MCKDASRNVWTIKTVGDETIDDVTIYYPTNLPANMQKEGLMIRLSGNIYEIEQVPTIGGMTFYGLFRLSCAAAICIFLYICIFHITNNYSIDDKTVILLHKDNQ